MSDPDPPRSCEACGKPAAGPDDLELVGWAGRLRLVCRDCRLVAMIDRAARRRPRP